MLPGVGIFGSDPVSKVLIQLLKHFEFEVHAIWTNHLVDSSLSSNNTSVNSSGSGGGIQKSCSGTSMDSRLLPKLITTSVDHVLLNKNVNLVFVCCQPNLHAQIASKALGKTTKRSNAKTTKINLLPKYEVSNASSVII
jgi:predicted dehydrogenase